MHMAKYACGDMSNQHLHGFVNTTFVPSNSPLFSSRNVYNIMRKLLYLVLAWHSSHLLKLASLIKNSAVIAVNRSVGHILDLRKQISMSKNRSDAKWRYYASTSEPSLFGHHFVRIAIYGVTAEVINAWFMHWSLRNEVQLEDIEHCQQI